MKERTKLKGVKFNVFIACWLIYFSTYICRLNFSAVIPELSNKGIFTEIQLAFIASVFFITYGVGQLVNGILGDKLNPMFMMLGGLMLTGICNVAIFFFHTYNVFIFLWIINGFSQAMIWPPLIRIAGQYYNAKEKVKFCTDITTTVPLGTLAGYGISLLLIQFTSWEYVFLVCGGIVMVVSVVMFVLLKANMGKLVEINNALDEVHIEKYNFKKFLKLFIPSGLLLLFIPLAIHGLLKDGVTSWVPKYISDTFNLTTSLSLLLTLILPIVNVAGAYVAKWLNTKIKGEFKVSAILFSAAVLALTVLILFGKYNVIINVLCITVVTSSMFAINYFYISIIPLYFAKYNRVSTMSGILNAVAYIGTGVSNILVGYLLNISWNAVILFWIAMAVLSIILALIVQFLWTKFTKNDAKTLK